LNNPENINPPAKFEDQNQSMRDTQKTVWDGQSDEKTVFHENKLMATKYATLEMDEQAPWSSNVDLKIED